MNPTDANASEQGRSDQPCTGDLYLKEQEVLAKVRELAQQIVERVNKALGDTAPLAPLPTEEKPALQ